MCELHLIIVFISFEPMRVRAEGFSIGKRKSAKQEDFRALIPPYLKKPTSRLEALTANRILGSILGTVTFETEYLYCQLLGSKYIKERKPFMVIHPNNSDKTEYVLSAPIVPP
jgi:hypothetical protein